MIERVHIADEFSPWGMGHRVVILGRDHPGARLSWMTADGSWEPLKEGVVSGDPVGFRFPGGTLDALVAAYQKVAAPQPATERHLTDAIEVRDRLLALVEPMFQNKAHLPLQAFTPADGPA